MQISSGGDRPARRFDLAGNDFLSRVFAATAAVGHRQVALHFRKRSSAPIHDFADLSVANAIAEADVHTLARWEG
jgi:hypothetical protein